MKRKTRQPIQTLSVSIVLACVVVLWGTGCTTSDPEYSRQILQARTNCKANDIVGVWISRTNVDPFDPPFRQTLLIRPDGTGLLRLKQNMFLVCNVTWSYCGNGLWQGEARDVESAGNVQKFTIHLTDHKLLWRSSFALGLESIFVPSDDEHEVEEHLKARHQLLGR